jgi:hypothetical protein
LVNPSEPFPLALVCLGKLVQKPPWYNLALPNCELVLGNEVDLLRLC